MSKNSINVRTVFLRGLFLCVLLAVALAGLLFPLPGNSILSQLFVNIAHVWLFCLLTTGILAIFNVKQWMTYGFICVVLFLFGFAMELVQPYFNRSSSTDDIVNNALGIASGLLLYLGISGIQVSQIKRLLSVIGSITILLISSIIPLQHLYVWLVKEPLPIIENFEHRWSLLRIESIGNVDLVLQENIPLSSELTSQHLKVIFKPSDYSGFTILEPHANWTSYETFEFEVLNPSNESIRLAIRIDDKHHNNEYSDRFNWVRELSPGYSKISISTDSILNMGLSSGISNRSMDMENITKVLIFIPRPEKEKVLVFDNFTLN